MNFDVPYAFTKRLPNVSMDAARNRVEAALKAEGFGVLTEIDVQATLKKKLGVETAPYVILGACNPQLAHRAISENPAVGLLLPCNVVLAADGEDLVVAAAAPTALFGVTEPEGGASPVAKEAEERIRRAIDTL